MFKSECSREHDAAAVATDLRNTTVITVIRGSLEIDKGDACRDIV